MGRLHGPFIDLAFLKCENVTDGRVEYVSRKTGKSYDTKISEQFNEILAYFAEGKLKGDFIFPVIKGDNLAEHYDEILWSLKHYSKKLRKIAILAEINEVLTT